MLLGVCCLLAVAQPAAAQQGAGFAPAARGAGHEYLGVRRCRLCHDRPANGADDELRLTEFVQLNEYRTWREHDLHARAYQVLEGPVARRMGAALGIEPAEDLNCLACHATLEHGRAPAAERRDELRLGVSCESCHGPSSDWFVEHMEPSWRTKPTREKESLGMIDMRDAVSRASQCLSCHLGSASEGKYVTHDMYAAGHPPLSGFEVETFLRAMPPHWTPLAQKSAAVQAKLNYDGAQHDSARSALVSGLLAQQRSIELLAAQTTTAAAATPPRWPDFAAFDCYACHHDLKSPSWRQQRGYEGKPGRPPLHNWPAALAETGLLQSADKPNSTAMLQQYNESLRQLRNAVASRPFGDAAAIGNPEDATSASGALVVLLDAQVAALNAAKFDREAALAAMRSLCGGDGAAPLRDYSAARQVAWALTSMYGELDPKPESDAAIRQLLEELHAAMKLALPGAAADGDTGGGDSSGAVEQALPALLGAMSDYDPLWFNEQLAALREML